MNRLPSIGFRAALAAIILCCGVGRMQAQGPATAAPPASSAPAPAKAPEAPMNPFAPQPAPPLPAGMKGTDVTDPTSKLSPGSYDTGEAAVGIKHLQLVKKPAAFELGTVDPDDPRVKKTLSQLGIGGDLSKIPKPLPVVFAQ